MKRAGTVLVGLLILIGCEGGSTSTSGSGGAGGYVCDCEVGAYVPVCGVDRMTYDAACGTHCVPVDIACQGECPCSPCALLEQQYADQISMAKHCSLALQNCKQLVAGELACQCPTYVAANQDVVAELDSLLADWNAQGCGLGSPPCSCAQPSGAKCAIDPSSDGDAGLCSDTL